MIPLAYGFVELDATALAGIDGGKISPVKWWFVKEVIENWDDIKQGVVDGWNGDYQG